MHFHNLSDGNSQIKGTCFQRLNDGRLCNQSVDHEGPCRFESRSTPRGPTREIDRLRQWKESALKELAAWDLVADLVPEEHMPLGSHKAESVRRYLKNIVAQDSTKLNPENPA